MRVAAFLTLAAISPLHALHPALRAYLIETVDRKVPRGGPMDRHPAGGGGIDYQDDYMLGGLTVEEAIYPWAVRIYLNRDHLCGGSLIADRTVITAGHCVKDKVTARYRVAAGHPRLPLRLANNNETLARARLYAVQRIILHPGYSIADDDKFSVNDFALLILETSVSFGRSQGPICLPQAVSPVKPDGTVIGWGQTNSLIDFLNQYARIDVEQVDLKTTSNPEEKMYKILTQLIPGSEEMLVKNLKIRKEVSAVQDHITQSYVKLFRQRGVEESKIGLFISDVLPDVFATFKKLIDLDNSPQSNQRFLLAEYNPFVKGPRSAVLKESRVRFETAKTCAAIVRKANSHLGTDITYENSFLCVSPEEGKDRGYSCLGDSGSPVFYRGSGGRYFLAGVFSFFFEDIDLKWPPSCYCFCERSKHSVYANVGQVLSWIKRNMVRSKIGQEVC